jgi:hypothetical protein
VPTVRPYLPTWADTHYKRDLASLDEPSQQAHLARLAKLIETLIHCRHPHKEPALAGFKPTPYPGVIKLPDAHLVEYRLDKLCRVIACWFEKEAMILLVAVTLTHDHDRLKRLIRRDKPSLSE